MQISVIHIALGANGTECTKCDNLRHGVQKILVDDIPCEALSLLTPQLTSRSHILRTSFSIAAQVGQSVHLVANLGQYVATTSIYSAQYSPASPRITHLWINTEAIAIERIKVEFEKREVEVSYTQVSFGEPISDGLFEYAPGL